MAQWATLDALYIPLHYFRTPGLVLVSPKQFSISDLEPGNLDEDGVWALGIEAARRPCIIDDGNRSPRMQQTLVPAIEATIPCEAVGRRPNRTETSTRDGTTPQG